MEEDHEISNGEAEPSIWRVMLRLGTFFAVLAFVAHVLWAMFSETAALMRLEATAKEYRYPLRCDQNGTFIGAGPLNCVDLNHYIFIYGPVSKAYRRPCGGRTAAMLSLAGGKVAATEINRIEKMLAFRALNGSNSPCSLPDPAANLG